MRIVKAVIGMATGLMQLVMRVRPIQGIPNGGNNNGAVDTQPQQQPAKTSRTRKPSVAPQTSQVKSRKPAQKTAQQTNGQRGKRQVTPAQPTPRHAKQAPKRKP